MWIVNPHTANNQRTPEAVVIGPVMGVGNVGPGALRTASKAIGIRTLENTKTPHLFWEMRNPTILPILESRQDVGDLKAWLTSSQHLQTTCRWAACRLQ